MAFQSSERTNIQVQTSELRYGIVGRALLSTVTCSSTASACSLFYQNCCFEVDRYGSRPSVVRGDAATKDDGISLFASNLPASGPDCA